MSSHSRFVVVNGVELRKLRLARGWTQTQLAKLSGYTERLIRKAEHGGSLDMSTILDLAETLSTPEYRVPLELITIDIVSIAKKWVESFDKLHRKMLPEIEAYLADDFVFNCPGDPAMAPFVGVWERREGLQKWLDTFFDFFEEIENTELEYLEGENRVHARWVVHCKLKGQPCAPVRINMHFRFVDGLISRIDDEYDTHGGSLAIEEAKARLHGRFPPIVE
jgi:transcriptional regulator with XRE-family HTH domain